jgi:hypothetical protein
VTFRCSAASLEDGEALAGTAPTEQAFLFVEYAGAWGRDAPALLREHVDIPDGVRPQLIRRHRLATEGGLRVFVAWRCAVDGADGFRVETTVLGSLTELGSIDLEALAAGRSPHLTSYDGPLWLVCTNGRRDVCCAELGRPVAAALTDQWPSATWETTHLGGHRFAATMLAMPSGITLGRLDAESAAEACRELESGGHPTSYSRGRAGLPPAEQVLDVHVARTGADPEALVVIERPGPLLRMSCADDKQKPTTLFEIHPRSDAEAPTRS